MNCPLAFLFGDIPMSMLTRYPGFRKNVEVPSVHEAPASSRSIAYPRTGVQEGAGLSLISLALC